MKVFDALASVAGRISTGTAMAVAILVGLWPDHAREIDPVRLGAVITTIVAWLAAEIASGRKTSDHDVALFKNIVGLLPTATVDFLRDHDFHNSYSKSQQDGLFDLAASAGSRSQFLDKSLQSRWASLLTSIKGFSAQLASGTGPVGAGPMFSAHPDHGDKDDPEPWVSERIDKLNSAASKLSSDIDAFETFARHRLRL